MNALIVDDDRIMADIVAFAMRREGFQVIQAYDGLSALELWSEVKPDIVILDVNLPLMDGFNVCQQIRRQADTPIILLTVRCEDEEIVYGLDLGADDYVTKPFSPRQLVARARAVLRRARQFSTQSVSEAGDVILDSNHRTVRIHQGSPISLTALEVRLLDYLIANSGQNMPSENIMEYIWGPGRSRPNVLRQLVHRLRCKIEPDTDNPIFIRTIHGFGYGFRGDYYVE